MGILKAMVFGKRSMMLKDIAAAADMPPSKAHRYLVSLIRSGLVEQDPLTSRYNLGPFALNIGLVAIDRLDRIRLHGDLPSCATRSTRPPRWPCGVTTAR
jgi:DNA-binding IclR family transcriptional regulator